MLIIFFIRTRFIKVKSRDLVPAEVVRIQLLLNILIISFFEFFKCWLLLKRYALVPEVLVRRGESGSLQM